MKSSSFPQLQKHCKGFRILKFQWPVFSEVWTRVQQLTGVEVEPKYKNDCIRHDFQGSAPRIELFRIPALLVLVMEHPGNLPGCPTGTMLLKTGTGRVQKGGIRPDIGSFNLFICQPIIINFVAQRNDARPDAEIEHFVNSGYISLPSGCSRMSMQL